MLTQSSRAAAVSLSVSPLPAQTTLPKPVVTAKQISPKPPASSKTNSAQGEADIVVSHDDNSWEESSGAIATIAILFFAILWFVIANRPTLLAWQMYQHVIKNRIAALPDTDSEKVVLVPEVCARGRLKAANANRHSDVSEFAQLTNGSEPVWRSALVRNDWIGRLLCSDSGVIEVSARKQDRPVIHSHRFLIGERSPLWCFLLAWLPFSYMIKRSYERDVDGNWSLVFVCPWFRFTWFGTLIPSAGFVVRVASNGVPSLLNLNQAQQLYPDLPLFPSAVAELYAEAYAVWCGGIRDQLLNQARPLSFFNYEQDQELASARVENYFGLGAQYTVLLGLDESQGGALHSVVLFDVHTGTPRLFERAAGTVLFGPLEAISTVKTEFGRANHRYAAPRLICSGGNLYWLVTVLGVPYGEKSTDDQGLIGHRVVDASTNVIVNLPLS